MLSHFGRNVDFVEFHRTWNVWELGLGHIIEVALDNAGVFGYFRLKYSVLKQF